MFQGFPRADIDIPAVRSERQRLSGEISLHLSFMKYCYHAKPPEHHTVPCLSLCAVLRNDHKEITDAIEKNLNILHSGGFTRRSSESDKRTGLSLLTNLVLHSDCSAAVDGVSQRLVRNVRTTCLCKDRCISIEKPARCQLKISC